MTLARTGGDGTWKERLLDRLKTPAGMLTASVVATALLYVVPFGRTVGYPLVLLSTVVHELGHGVTAVLVGGRFESFRMAWDASGLALVSTGGGRLSTALVAAGGLTGPAFAALFGFVLARRPGTARVFLVALGVALGIASAWVVRGVTGLVVVPAFAAAFLALGLRARPWVAQLALAFLAVQLSLSVFSRGDYLFTDHAGAGPSDVANMASALVLPYWFWGLVCGAVSVAALALGSWSFVRGTRGVVRDVLRAGRAARSRSVAAGR